MARFARIDSQIRANRMILANHLRVPELNPFFANRASGGPKLVNRRFEAIRANRLHVVKVGVFLRIDSCDPIRENRPDSRCESPGHLSAKSDLVSRGRGSQKSLSHSANPVSHQGKLRTRDCFWVSRAGGLKTPFATLLSIVGYFGCFFSK